MPTKTKTRTRRSRAKKTDAIVATVATIEVAGAVYPYDTAKLGAELDAHANELQKNVDAVRLAAVRVRGEI